MRDKDKTYMSIGVMKVVYHESIKREVNKVVVYYESLKGELKTK